jgi:hypothetical protein
LILVSFLNIQSLMCDLHTIALLPMKTEIVLDRY